MAIYIEICKSCIKDKWRIRIGDVEGSSEHINISKEEILDAIKEELNTEEIEESL
jgi:hypothetical protein